MGTKVHLNVYDLSPANDYLYPIGFGLHHSGVEILGKEYTFASGGGVFDHSPGEAPGAKHRERLELGIFEGTSADVNSAISELKSQFGPNSYNLITKNCNSFANALVWVLLRKTIPSHVNRLADIGSCCSCLIPKQMLEAAPVGDTNSSNGSGFQVSGGNGRISSFGPGKSEMSRPSFSGTGNTLNSPASSNHNTSTGMNIRSLLGRDNSSSNKGVDDLIDRREKARKAALARFEHKSTNDGR